MINLTNISKLFIITGTLLVSVRSWKSCSDTFCGRVRNSPEGYDGYEADLTNLSVYPDEVIGYLNSPTLAPLTFDVVHVSDSLLYLGIVDQTDIHNQPLTSKHLKLDPVPQSSHSTLPKVLNRTTNTVTFGFGNNSVVIYGSPFKIEFFYLDTLVSVANANQRLVLELGDKGTAVALDVSFPATQRAYGIPLHADRLSLQNTKPGFTEPYRLFNMDSGSYEIGSPKALYGSVPTLYTHGPTQSSGVLWYNYGQTWVDLTIGPNQVDAFFMSETGPLLMFVFTGPTLAAAVQQNLKPAGKPMMQQYFAFGYHQSRRTYMTEDEVRTVVAEFDKSALPLESVWLDIDYTDNKKYFTWDPVRFPNPIKLQNDLASTNRKLVVLIDSHIKVEQGYFLHDNASANGYYVKNPDGSDYVGKCWPGSSSYLDWFNKDATDYYSSLYSIDTFKNDNVHVWHDMNEPVVFENKLSEDTLSADLLHDEVGQHKVVHNIYGLYQSLNTYMALLTRNPRLIRPFIMSRSHFTGIQRFAAISTGDNNAAWKHLEISFPMCLSEALAGVSFCGANIGGFNGIPSDELYQRWYQAGAWLPFYRGHSADNVPRREPYLYTEGIKGRIRKALNQRYAHLPTWYTAFWEYRRNGDPVIRPITYHYPQEEDAFDIDTQVLLGANILAAPILKQGIFTTAVYLPGGENEIWYNIDDNYKVLAGTGYHLLNVDLDSVPVFYRGGAIVSRKDTPRQSSMHTLKDPYTLYICLDLNNQAEGTLYVDDYETMDYISSKYLYTKFTYSNDTFSSTKIDGYADYNGASEVGQIKILNPPKYIAGAKIEGKDDYGNMELKTSYSDDGVVLTIEDIGANLRKPFTIKLFTL